MNILFSVLFGIFLLTTIFYIAFNIYCWKYFNSDKFKTLKQSIAEHVNNCNDLNNHIEDLKSSYVNIKSYDYGQGNLHNNSKFNFKRSRWKEINNSNHIHNCSASVLKNAMNNPVKYFCKYFDVKESEDSLQNIEEVLNAFSAAEQGKRLLVDERNSILSSISNLVPGMIYSFANKELIENLGFENVDLSNLYFPIYTFQYVSPGGNSSSKCVFVLNISNLGRLIEYLGDKVKFKKSSQYQRQLMTLALRDQIKLRDNDSCQICGISTKDEAHLLLEIDHIVPISKGGITAVDNLQTLCWKCNRSKGAKIQAT